MDERRYTDRMVSFRKAEAPSPFRQPHRTCTPLLALGAGLLLLRPVARLIGHLAGGRWE